MTESLGKLTLLLEAAKNMTMEAAATASSRLSDSTQKLSPQEISKCLNSRVENDTLRGIRSVIYLMCKGEDVVEYFADVVKNITSPNQKIKNLVLVYVTKFAELEPDTALLAINSIQKLLNEKDTVVRARSTRALANIRIIAIVPIVLLTIKRTVADPSPLVRSATAAAIESCYLLDDTNSKELLEHLSKLLADSEIQVVEAAVKCYYGIRAELKPLKKWAPIHGNFRRLCSMISEFDEWTQCFIVDILVEYCRLFIPRPKLYVHVEDQTKIVDMPYDFSAYADVEYEVSYDDDYGLFIDSLRILTYSTSDSVVLSVARAYYTLTPPLHFALSGLDRALLRIATSSFESYKISDMAYRIIFSICLKNRNVFAPHYTSFFLYPTDSLSAASAKLQILCVLVDEENFRGILEELKYYSIKFPKVSVARRAITAIGDCTRVSPVWNQNILKWCLGLLKKPSGPIISEILTLVRYLLQQIQNSGDANNDIVKTTAILAQILTQTNLSLEPKARIIWMIGEFTVQCQNKIGPDVLRTTIRDYASEGEAVRYQTLLLAAKAYCYEISKTSVPNETITAMFNHILHAAKYDVNFDTRDRARVLSVLLDSNANNSELACLFLQSPKPILLKGQGHNNFETTSFTKFLHAAKWADPETLPPSAIRKEAAVLVNSYASKISSADFRSSPSSSSPRALTPPITSHSISSKAFQGNSNASLIAKNARDQLQSLDDFFGNGESDSSELSEEEESEEDESEEESEEESEDNGEDNDDPEDDDEDEDDEDEEMYPKSSDDEADPKSKLLT